MKLVLIMILAYLAGSVNFSIILFRLLGRDDPRKSFSGNAGTTNVYRLAGPVHLVDVHGLAEQLGEDLARFAVGLGGSDDREGVHPLDEIVA